MKTIAHFFERDIGFKCLKILAHDGGDIRIVAVTKIKNAHSPQVQEFCAKHNIELIPADNPNDAAFLLKLKDLDVRLAFAISYSRIFKQALFDAIPEGIINLHPALLPRNGGCYPTMWSLLEGESETGYTLHKIDEGIDTGPIIAQVRVAIAGNDTGESLYAKQVYAGTSLFRQWLPAMIAGQYESNRQFDKGSYHKNELPYGGYIPWEKDFAFIERMVRAFAHSAYPGVLVKLDTGDAEVYAVERVSSTMNIPTIGGFVRQAGEVFFRCRDAVVKIYFL